MTDEPKWADVEAWAVKEIRTLRNFLEAGQHEDATATLRGEIRALRRLLKLAEPPAPTNPDMQVQPQGIDY